MLCDQTFQIYDNKTNQLILLNHDNGNAIYLDDSPEMVMHKIGPPSGFVYGKQLHILPPISDILQAIDNDVQRANLFFKNCGSVTVLSQPPSPVDFIEFGETIDTQPHVTCYIPLTGIPPNMSLLELLTTVDIQQQTQPIPSSSSSKKMIDAFIDNYLYKNEYSNSNSLPEKLNLENPFPEEENDEIENDNLENFGQKPKFAEKEKEIDELNNEANIFFTNIILNGSPVEDTYLGSMQVVKQNLLLDQPVVVAGDIDVDLQNWFDLISTDRSLPIIIYNGISDNRTIKLYSEHVDLNGNLTPYKQKPDNDTIQRWVPVEDDNVLAILFLESNPSWALLYSQTEDGDLLQRMRIISDNDHQKPGDVYPDVNRLVQKISLTCNVPLPVFSDATSTVIRYEYDYAIPQNGVIKKRPLISFDKLCFGHLFSTAKKEETDKIEFHYKYDLASYLIDDASVHVSGQTPLWHDVLNGIMQILYEEGMYHKLIQENNGRKLSGCSNKTSTSMLPVRKHIQDEPDQKDNQKDDNHPEENDNLDLNIQLPDDSYTDDEDDVDDLFVGIQKKKPFHLVKENDLDLIETNSLETSLEKKNKIKFPDEEFPDEEILKEEIPLKKRFVKLQDDGYAAFSPFVSGKNVSNDQDQDQDQNQDQNQNDNVQTFISAIAYIYSNKNGTGTTVGLDEMKLILKNAITKEQFLQANQGRLARQMILMNKKMVKTGHAFGSTDESDDTAFKIFQYLYLNPKNTVTNIDESVLWEFVVTPNEMLFPTGINLIVIDNKTREIVCPLFHDPPLYVPGKPTKIILKHGPFQFTNSDDDDEQPDPDLLAAIDRCRLTGTAEDHVDPLSMDEIEQLTQKHGYEITAIIVDDEQKTSVVGVEIQGSGGSGDKGILPVGGNIPPDPTSTIKNAADMDIWFDYTHTLNFLKHIATLFEKDSILPKFKIVQDDQQVIGFVTQSGETVTIYPPTGNNESDGIAEYFQPGKGAQGDEEEEGEEEGEEEQTMFEGLVVGGGASKKNIKKKKKKMNKKKDKKQMAILETNFYQVFRNTARILLHRLENKISRDKISHIVQHPGKPSAFYKNLDKILYLLKNVMKHHIEYTYFSTDVLNSIHDTHMTTCVNHHSSMCNVKTAYCGMSSSKCILHIPNKNLSTGIPRGESFYIRLADELLRYEHVRNYVLHLNNDNMMMNKIQFIGGGHNNKNKNKLKNQIIIHDKRTTSLN